MLKQKEFRQIYTPSEEMNEEFIRASSGLDVCCVIFSIHSLRFSALSPSAVHAVHTKRNRAELQLQ